MLSIVTYPMMPSWEWWIFVLSGAALIGLTITAGILEWRVNQLTDARHSQEHTGIATGTEAIYNRLASMSNIDIKQEPTKIAEAAVFKIATLETQVKDLTASQADLTTMFWRRLSPRECQILKGLLESVRHRTIRISSEPQLDCRELRSDLYGVFKAAGWGLEYAGDDPMMNQQGAMRAGIHVLGKYEDPEQIGSRVMDLLRPFVLGGLDNQMEYFAGLDEKDSADAVIFIGVLSQRGHRGLPSGQR